MNLEFYHEANAFCLEILSASIEIIKKLHSSGFFPYLKNVSFPDFLGWRRRQHLRHVQRPDSTQNVIFQSLYGTFRNLVISLKMPLDFLSLKTDIIL